MPRGIRRFFIITVTPLHPATGNYHLPEPLSDMHHSCTIFLFKKSLQKVTLLPIFIEEAIFTALSLDFNKKETLL